MKFNPLPWLLVVAVFAVAVWIRFSLIEQTELGFFCDGGGQTTQCRIRWLIVQAFNHYGLGYFSLFLGLLALISRAGLAGLLAAMVGAAGLVLYTWDYSAVAFLLGSLTLARAQVEDYRSEHGTG
jgi:hypothetical protein